MEWRYRRHPIFQYDLWKIVSVNVIPNHFQPYSGENSPIYMIQPLVEDARLFRGDADQDKPRLYGWGRKESS